MSNQIATSTSGSPATSDEIPNDVESSRREILTRLLGVAAGGMAVQVLAGCGAEAAESGPEDDLAKAVWAATGTVTTNVRWADTASQLRTITGGTVNWIAQLRGYSAVGDGGGGLFYWSTTAKADDGWSVLNSGSGNSAGWRRVHPGVLSASSVTLLRALGGGATRTVAVLTGYAAHGDGGGGVFYWDTTAAVDNGGTILNSGGLGTSSAGWRRLYSGPVDVRWFGASTSASATTNTNAISGALAASSRVVVPAGAYSVSTVNVPAHTTLELSHGAVLLVSDHVELIGYGATLKGDVWQSARLTLAEPGNFGNIVYQGTGGAVLRAAVSVFVNAWHVDGITVDCKGIAGTTGMQIGSSTTSGAYGSIGTLTIINATNGVDIQAWQNSKIDRLNLEQTSDSFSPSGVGLNFRATTVVTLIDVGYISQTGYGTGILMGDPTDTVKNPPSSIRIGGGVIQGFPENGGVGLNLHACYDVQIRNLQIPGPGGQDPPTPDGTTVAIILGGTSTAYTCRADHTTIESCDIAGFKVMVQGYGWRGLWIEKNNFLMVSTNASRAFFSNIGAAGVLRRDGHWSRNVITGQTNVDNNELPDTTGFTSAIINHVAESPNNTVEGTYDLLGWQRALNGTASGLNGPTLALFPDTFFGAVDIGNVASGYIATFFVRGNGSHYVDKALDPAVAYSNAANNQWTVNLYWEATTSRYTLQNNTAGPQTLAVRPRAFTNFRQV